MIVQTFKAPVVGQRSCAGWLASYCSCNCSLLCNRRQAWCPVPTNGKAVWKTVAERQPWTWPGVMW